MRTIELRFVDTKPGVPTGVTWGVPVPAGELQAGDTARRRAWALLLQGDNDPREPKPGFQPRQFLTTPITTTDFGTNMAAMLSLNLIACLAPWHPRRWKQPGSAAETRQGDART